MRSSRVMNVKAGSSQGRDLTKGPGMPVSTVGTRRSTPVSSTDALAVIGFDGRANNSGSTVDC